MDRTRSENEGKSIRTDWHVLARNSDGDVISVQDVPNVVVNGGKNLVTSLSFQTSTSPAKFGWTAIGTRTDGATTSEVSPTNSGDVTNWTALSGNNWQNVDDPPGTPDDDTTYVYATESVGGPSTKADLYRFAKPFTTELTTVSVVDVYVRNRKSGAVLETEPTLSIIIKTNGSVSAGSGYTLSTAYVTNNRSMATNPVTGNPWTSAEVDALQAGISATSLDSQAQARATQVYVHVQGRGFLNLPDAAETALETESNRVANTFTKLAGIGQCKLDSSHTGITGTIREVGLFNAASAGTMFNRATISGVPLTTNDILDMTVTVSFL